MIDRRAVIAGAMAVLLAPAPRPMTRSASPPVAAGIGLSAAGMVAAALGYLTPVVGALLQEAIDVAVILNALRALRITPAAAGANPP